MAEAAETEGKKKGKSGLIIILLLVILVLGGGGGVAAFVLMRPGAGSRASAEGAKGGGEHGGGAKDAKGAERGVLSLESFIANLADTDNDRYIKCTMRLELDDKLTAEKIKADELAITKIRDRILTLLTSKTYSQVASSEGKDNLRGEIAKQLEPILDGGHVSGVYYTEFIVQ